MTKIQTLTDRIDDLERQIEALKAERNAAADELNELTGTPYLQKYLGWRIEVKRLAKQDAWYYEAVNQNNTVTIGGTVDTRAEAIQSAKQSIEEKDQWMAG